MIDEALCNPIANEIPDPFETLVNVDINNPSMADIVTMLEATM